LFRTKDDIILLAHRLPQTSLHYSLDEGKTWSETVRVDDFIGAYPSMANLADGSVLIVYYEEGVGSNIRARRFRASASGIEWLAVADGSPVTRPDPQAERGEPDVRVEEADGRWRLSGLKNSVLFDPATLRLEIQAGSATWATEASAAGDMEVKHSGKTFKLKLAEVAVKKVGPMKTGSETGLAVELSGFRAEGEDLDLALRLTLAMDGRDEELVFSVGASDGADRLRECRWPPAVEPGSFDAAVVPFMQGMLLPHDWPRKVALYDSLSYGRGLYMPWWGYERGGAGVMVILETPEDGGCRFEHPAGGPTRLGPRWVHSLGRWTAPRRARIAFVEKGGYVAMAKRYRRYVRETGRFVSLREKIARNPLVGKLVGAPVIHTSILYHIQPQSSYYDRKDPARNHQLVTFDKRAGELAGLARSARLERAYVHLDGWGFRGYDNLHPDILPPCPEAGGWEGMKRFAEACERLGFIFAIHDQYRDYYLDAASYNPSLAQGNENGELSFHSTWYGGAQTYLCPSLAPGHVRKNHVALLERAGRSLGAREPRIFGWKLSPAAVYLRRRDDGHDRPRPGGISL
jgi:hypothetical protein